VSNPVRLAIFEGFRALEPGWDSYEGIPPREHVICAAIDATEAMAATGAEMINAVPRCDGSISVSFRRGGDEWTISISNEDEL